MVSLLFGLFGKYNSLQTRNHWVNLFLAALILKKIYSSVKNIQFNFQEAILILVFQHWDKKNDAKKEKKKRSKSHFCNQIQDCTFFVQRQRWYYLAPFFSLREKSYEMTWQMRFGVHLCMPSGFICDALPLVSWGNAITSCTFKTVSCCVSWCVVNKACAKSEQLRDIGLHQKAWPRISAPEILIPKRITWSQIF